MPVVAQVLLLAAAPVALFVLLWLMVLAPASYRRPFAAVWSALAGRVARLVRRVARRPEPEPEPVPAVDPFAALGVQLALARLTAELELLARDDSVYARGFRFAATQAAYDDVLAQACDLARVPLQRRHGEDRQVGRLLEEAELARHGWFW